MTSRFLICDFLLSFLSVNYCTTTLTAKMKATIKYSLLFLLFSTLFVLPAIIFPFPLVQKSQSDVEPLMLFVLLLVDFIGVVYLIERINLSGMKLFLAVVMVFWGFQTFLMHIENWYFLEALPPIIDQGPL